MKKNVIMSILTIIAAVIAACAFHTHTLIVRERNDMLYKHADLSPVTRDQLQNYWAINKAARERRLVVKITEDIYSGVLENAAAGKPGYWHGLRDVGIRHRVTDIVNALRPLFQKCDIEYSVGLDAIGVFWNKHNTDPVPNHTATITVVPVAVYTVFRFNNSS